MSVGTPTEMNWGSLDSESKFKMHSDYGNFLLTLPAGGGPGIIKTNNVKFF
jgi:hypothetical protein